MRSCLLNYRPSWEVPLPPTRLGPVLGQDRPSISLVFSPSPEQSRLSVSTSEQLYAIQSKEIPSLVFTGLLSKTKRDKVKKKCK